MKKLYVVVLFAFACNFINGQSQQITFSKALFYYTFYSVTTTNDNGYLAVGTGDSAYNDDGFIMKIDSVGNYLWSKKIGGSGTDGFYSVVPTRDFGYILCGYTYSIPFTNGNDDMFIVKINSIGDTIWSRTFGNTGSDVATSCQQTNDNGYIIGGSYNGNICVIKLDSLGNLIWNKSFSGSGVEVCNTIKQTSDSGYVLIGTTNSFSSSFADEICLLKLSSAGTLLWAKRYGYGYANYGHDFELTNNGIVCYVDPSWTNSQTALMKTDYSGNLLWIKSYDNIYPMMSGPTFLKMCMTKDSGFVFFTSTQIAGGGDYYVKTDSSGNTEWVGSALLMLHDVVAANDTGVVLVGEGPLFGSRMMNSYSEGGIIKTDSSGNTNTNWCAGATIGTNSVPSIGVNNAPFVTSTGGILKNVSPIIVVSGINYGDGCVSIIGGVPENNLEDNTSISPNPTSGIFSIQSSEKISAVEIMNVLGAKVYSLNPVGNNSNGVNHLLTHSLIDLSSQPSGIYFLQIKTDEGSATKKLIIQK
ncbi:MAG: T9SS type A sorting domain-containing protein [Bacteroidetes bacterium]|nr:T9SS type A sorting domain-containing protein [Bacteroidota bacterium]